MTGELALAWREPKGERAFVLKRLVLKTGKIKGAGLGAGQISVVPKA